MLRCEGRHAAAAALVCISHSPAESQLMQPPLPLRLAPFHVNAAGRCLAVRNGLYGHR